MNEISMTTFSALDYFLAAIGPLVIAAALWLSYFSIQGIRRINAETRRDAYRRTIRKARQAAFRRGVKAGEKLGNRRRVFRAVQMCGDN